MSLFSRLFGSKNTTSSAAPAQDYKGFQITPEPSKESGGFRIGARIEKEVEGELRVHHLIRADTIADPELARTASVDKAKQMIDEQGERIFR